MIQYQIEWVGTPNYTPGRGGRAPLAIVDHITAGLYPGALNWMQNPAAKASTHYLVLQNGRILQLVREQDTAWANGIANRPTWALYDGTNPNRYTVSIEHENLSGGNLTAAQYQASLWLHQKLIERWDIPITRDTIIGHNQIDTVNRPHDPGPEFPWDRLFKDLQHWQGGEQVAETWKEQLVKQARQKGLINEYHNPDEAAPKWFVLAVALNLLKKLDK
jgi:N-acetyl-anhydromuramyl-L-alanine amidase AmpD